MDLPELSCTEKNIGQQVHMLVTRTARESKSEWTAEVSVQPVKRAALQLQPVKQIYTIYTVIAFIKRLFRIIFEVFKIYLV